MNRSNLGKRSKGTMNEPMKEAENWVAKAMESAAAFDEGQRQVLVAELRSEAKMPLRHAMTRSAIEGANANWWAALCGLYPRLGKGFLVGLTGVRDTGKTQMGVELIKVMTTRLQSARYCTATEFLLEIKATYGDRERSELDVMNEFRGYKLLVMDEFGKRKGSDWEHLLIFELLNKRYGDLTDTMLISNQLTAEFMESIGDSMASRMKEAGGIIECDWKGMRDEARV